MSHDWHMDVLLGSGANGSAYLAYRMDYISNEPDKSSKYVIKKVFIGSETVIDKSDKLRETQLLAMIRHPYIVQYEDSFVEDGYLYVAMEFAGAGTLEKYTEPDQCKQPCHPSMIKSLFVQLTLAVAYLHDRHIVHRDIKPANVFLREDGCVKLGDLGEGWLRESKEMDPASRYTLGSAKSVCIYGGSTQSSTPDNSNIWKNDPQQQGQIVGTPYYLSPECWRGQCNAPEKADVWALGVTLYELCTLKRPWDANSVANLAMRICCDAAAAMTSCPEEALDETLQSIFNKNPDQRPSCRQVLSALVFSHHMKLLHVPEEEWDPSFGANQPRQALAPSSFLFSWGMSTFQPQCIESLLHKNIKQVCVGRYHVCAVSVDGELFTWSLITGGVHPPDSYAGLGHGSASLQCRHPKLVRSEVNADGEVIPLDIDTAFFVSVACGDRFSVALTGDAQLLTWGINTRGQLGQGSECEEQVLRPKRLRKPHSEKNLKSTRFIDVAAGDEHVLALSWIGDVYSWGCGEGGRLGHGDEENVESPQKIDFMHSQPADSSPASTREVYFMQVSCGEAHSGGVSLSGQVYVWGRIYLTVNVHHNSSNVFIVFGFARPSPHVHAHGGRLCIDLDEIDLSALNIERLDGDFIAKPLCISVCFPSSSTVVDFACGIRHTACILDHGDGETREVYVCGEGISNVGEEVCDDDIEDESGGDVMRKFYEGVQEGGGEMFNEDDDESDDINETTIKPNADTPVMIRVPPPQGGWTGPATLSCGQGFCAALTEDMRLYTWGEARAGQLGYQAGSAKCTHRPREVAMPLELSHVHVACGTQVAFTVAFPKSEKARKDHTRALDVELQEGGTKLSKGKSSKHLFG